MTQPWAVVEFDPRKREHHRVFDSENGPLEYVVWDGVEALVDTPEFCVIVWPSGWWQIWVKR